MNPSIHLPTNQLIYPSSYPPVPPPTPPTQSPPHSRGHIHVACGHRGFSLRLHLLCVSVRLSLNQLCGSPMQDESPGGQREACTEGMEMGYRTLALDSWTTAVRTFRKNCSMFGKGWGCSLWLKHCVFHWISQASLSGIKSMEAGQSSKLKQHGWWQRRSRKQYSHCFHQERSPTANSESKWGECVRKHATVFGCLGTNSFSLPSVSSTVGMWPLTLPSVLSTGEDGEPVPQTSEGIIGDTLGFSVKVYLHFPTYCSLGS